MLFPFRQYFLEEMEQERTQINLKANHEDLEDTYLSLSQSPSYLRHASASLRVLNETVDSIIVVMVTVICCATIPH